MRLDAGKWRNMETKRKLNEEIIKLNYRIAELEERLCPCGSHDWKKIGSRFEVLLSIEGKSIEVFSGTANNMIGGGIR